ncbi:hypothetical protein H5410_040958, partial [Solanum commersonii]
TPKICLNYGDKGFSNAFIYCISCLEVVHSHAAQHVDDPIWRGCYNIWDNKYTLDGVVAHLSLLQLHIHFEMVSKDDLWLKYFNTPEAIVDDIELFFFPSEAS